MKNSGAPSIAIIGAGAIGSLTGAFLARNGAQVVLVGRREHVEAIRSSGLRIDGVAGSFAIRLEAAEALAFRPDLAFIAVKNQDVLQTCHAIAPWIGDIPLVMMQNGVSAADTAASFFSPANIITCTLILNARFLSPGQVTYVKQNPIMIGKPFAANDASVRQVQALLANLAPTSISGKITGVQWSKLLMNSVGNALDGMSGLNLGQQMNCPQMNRIGYWILKEAYHLTAAARIPLASLPGLPLLVFKGVARMPSAAALWVLKRTSKAKGDHQLITSTLQSLLKGKPTEIDYLNGEIVRMAGRLSMAAPVNAKVVELIHEIERTHRFYTPAALLEIFAGLPKIWVNSGRRKRA